MMTPMKPKPIINIHGSEATGHHHHPHLQQFSRICKDEGAVSSSPTHLMKKAIFHKNRPLFTHTHKKQHNEVPHAKKGCDRFSKMFGETYQL